MATEKRKTPEIDSSSSVSVGLIGRVVEKGFTSSSTRCLPPQPTVIPFPVARHRSHGPHWVPLPTNSIAINGNGNDDNDNDNDNNNDTNSDRDAAMADLAEFAVPLVPKKQNTGMDFSRWRDLLQPNSNTTTATQVNDNVAFKRLNKIKNPIPVVGLPAAPIDMNQEASVASPVVDDVMEEDDFGAAKYPVVTSNSSLNREEKREPVPLESQIHAENYARLNEMSNDEVAEAQAEIMQKMNPSLLKILKKRGQTKLEQHKSTAPILDVGTGTNCRHLQRGSQSTPLLEEQEAQVPQVVPYIGNSRNGGMESTVSLNNDLWISWRERVEAARSLRFSLDGSMVTEINSFETSNTGGISDGNVSERDYLRTGGDPGAAGYTIKEAIELSRSMIPGQRAFALKLLASVLVKALFNLQRSQWGCDMSNFSSSDKLVDWKAVWAFALGPEPELALLLRLALDDNHSSVVSSSVKAIHSVLSCEMNESFFDLSAKLVTSQDIYTAPVFRSKPEIDAGCLHGGYWKYNTKPCNIFPLLCDDEMVDDDENEGKRTIKDDINVASQDFAAGLVRMGVLPKINYLLELQADHSADMEEPLISILIGLARHSPTCASAIIKYPGLVQTIVDIFIKKDTLEVHPSKIKTVTLIKVLAQSDKKVCTEFIEKGIFRTVTWHLYQYPLRLDDWINLGKGSCMLKSALTVEQLRLWKVCIKYGYCISYFADIFPGLYLWLSPPTFDKLIENDVFGEFTDVTRESYLVMEALARRLPYLHSGEQLKKQTIELSDTNVEMWSWSHVVPMVELALKWISLKTNPYLSEFLDSLKGTNTVSPFTNHLLWVISAVMHMLSSVMVKVTPKDYNGFCENDGRVLWLPEFVPSIGLEMIKNNFLNFSSTRDTKPSKRKSLVKLLCQLRRHSNYELSLSSVCCLHGLVQLIVSLDKSIQIAKKEIQTTFSQGYSFAAECKILEDGIVIQSRDELRCLLITLVTLVSHGWHDLQSIETFGRGGPAPGAGLGWGSSSGGFWSEVVLLKRTDALLLISLLEMFQIVPENDVPAIEEMTFIMQRVESALGACLCLGPRDTDIMESSLNVFLQAPVLKYLDICIGRLLVNRSVGPFGWKFREEDYQCFSKILLSHFKSRWLSIKWKKPSAAESNPEQDGSGLDTIYEDPDMSDVTISNPQCTSLIVEWAHQRLPLPVHWFLSPISTIGDHRAASDALQVVMSGLFLLLGLEAMSSLFCTNVECSPVCGVPLVWKIHSLSVVLLGGMGVLQEERSRDLYGTLQELYGQLLDESRCDRKAKSLLDKNERMMPEAGKQYEVDFLKFKSNINDSYSTFVEMLVDQFGAVSYGDVLYGRQVAVYLHHSVEVPVRVATWNILSNAHILELLPSLGKCLGATEGYLDTEDNEEVLEAYVKSWITGALDRAADRGSMSFTLALHHLSYFLFYNNTDDKSILRIKLTKSLLRDYLRKEQHKGMMLELIQYTKPETCGELERKEAALPHASEVERRFKLLAEACEGNRSLLDKVEKLKF